MAKVVKPIQKEQHPPSISDITKAHCTVTGNKERVSFPHSNEVTKGIKIKRTSEKISCIQGSAKFVDQHKHSCKNGPCKRNRCKCCCVMSTKNSIDNSGKNFVLPTANCSTKNVIYLITVKSSGKQYVGQTTQSLSSRLSGHKCSRTEEGGFASAVFQELCKSCGWKTGDELTTDKIEINILEQAPREKLDERESHYIREFKTHVEDGGLNKKR